MRAAVTLLSLVLLSFAACSGDHPLHGGWREQLPDGKTGLILEFDPAGSRVMVHGPERADGSGHEHIEGVTYSLEGQTLIVRGALAGPGGGDTWSGSIVGDRVELVGQKSKITLQRGASAHGH